MDKEYCKLQKSMAPPDQAAATLGQNCVSIKDVIGHRAHWIGLFLEWYKNGMAGDEAFFPDESYTWSDLKRYNADL